MNKDLLLPGAIVLGAALIALGLFLGLRDRQAPVVATSAAQPLAPPPVLASSAAQALPLISAQAAKTAASADVSRAQTEASRALAQTKQSLLTACWAPSIANAPEPPTSRYTVEVSFNVDGVEVARGISEVRGVPSRQDVAECLRKRPGTLRIPPPRSPVTVELTLDFP
jgi:hypothetical protein